MAAPHYFAYGSNMSSAELLAYCPSAHFLGIARLDGWRLAFTVYAAKRQGGVADIVELKGPASSPARAGDEQPGVPAGTGASPFGDLSPVWGVLWSIPTAELPALDAKEGFHPQRPDEQNMYRRIDLNVLLLVDQPLFAGGAESPALPLPGPPDPIPAFAYEVIRKAPQHVPPSRSYLDLVLRGAHEHALPDEYVRALAAVTTSV